MYTMFFNNKGLKWISLKRIIGCKGTDYHRP